MYKSKKDMSINLKWQDLDSLSPVVREKTNEAIKTFVQEHPDGIIDHDPEWLAAKSGKNKSFKVFIIFSEKGKIAGYAPFFVHPSSLSFEVFGISLFTYRIQRYCITACPLMHPGYHSTVLLEKLLLTIRDSLGRREAIFGLGIELQSDFGRTLLDSHKLKKNYLVFPSGRTYHRRYIILPKDSETYICSLGKTNRKRMKQAQRRLKMNNELSSSTFIYTDPEKVPELLELLEKVSRKTYQHNLLNLGVKNDIETQRTLTLAAENGWLRSYVLICNDEPIAFKHGYLYKDIFFSVSVGYDPKWSNWSAGKIIHMDAIHDLIQIGVKKFDFMYGDSEYKKSLSNSSRIEQNFYIIPRHTPISQIAYALRLLNATANLMGDLLERYKLKSRIRRFLRNRATKRKN